jgi:cbb3-type cytochrome oxidase subunit 3
VPHHLIGNLPWVVAHHAANWLLLAIPLVLVIGWVRWAERRATRAESAEAAPSNIPDDPDDGEDREP